MKKSTLSTAVMAAALLLSSNIAFAERSEGEQALLEGSTFIGTTVAGTIAGGPVGFVVGAISGAFLAKQTKKANDAELTQLKNKQELDDLENQLTKQGLKINDLEEQIIDKLTFQVLFATGEDSLNELDQRRVRILAYYLQQNPSLDISLDGHSDPRGTDEYNNVLSMERAISIKKALIEEGIEEQRIQCNGFGTQFSNATSGDHEAYTQERRVDITLHSNTLGEAHVYLNDVNDGVGSSTPHPQSIMAE